MPDPIAPAPTGSPIPSTTHQGSASAPQAVDITADKPISAIEKLGLKGKIQGPKEALGKSATSTSTVKADLKKLRERHAPKIVIPRADAKSVEKPAKTKEATKPADDKPPESAIPAIIEGSENKVDPKPEPVAKVKIGDKEMTPEEIAEEIKQLREKAEKAGKSPEEKKPTEAESEAQKTQAREAGRKAFLEHEMARTDDIDEKGLDIILSGGKDAVDKFRELRAKDKLEIREWASEAVNRLLAERDSQIKPVLDQHREFSQYRSESEFLTKHPAIKDNPKGIEESRQVRHAMTQYYDSIQQKIAQGTATSEEKQHAERYEHATPQEFNDSVAAHVCERLGIDPNAPKPVAAAVVATPPVAPVAATPPKPQPKPPAGQPPGGTSTPAAMSEQQMHIARMRAARV